MIDDVPDNVRPIESARTVRERRKRHEHRQREEADRFEEHAQAVAEELRTHGATVIACGEAERVRIRRVGRRAGKIIGRAVRITVVDGLIAVWDEERGDNPLQVLIDRVRAEKLIDQAPKRRGPPGDEGFPFLPRADPVPRPEDRTDRP